MIHFQDKSVVLHHGDCLDVLRELPDASVDSVVTDPPYGLEFMGKEWDRLAWGGADQGGTASRTQNRQSTSPLTNAPRYGTAPRQMQEWHHEWAVECLRVLKPGGHLLAFGGTRTWHRLACAVEDAGFEVRDSLAWLYGSGFPKSLDVSKAIDKQRKDDPAWRVVGQWLKGYREAAGFRTRADLAPLILDGHKNLESAAANLSNWENGLSFPTWDRWLSLKEILSLPDDVDAEVWRLNGRKGTPGEAWESRPVSGLHSAGLATGSSGVGGFGAGKERRDAPATPEAERWQGWGTALKPAFEPVVVARKPLSGTVAANVLAHGTGALNIGACRVETTDDLNGGAYAKVGGRSESASLHAGSGMNVPGATTGKEYVAPAGRWPANVILDESQAAALDEMSGTLTSGANPTRRGTDKFREAYGDFKGQEECTPARGVDVGGASRFFKVAEDDLADCCDDCEWESAQWDREDEQSARRPIDTLGPRFRYEPKADASERPRVDGVAHPTVKPLALMRWLVRLVTPPGGTVLEPFAGSGTTVEACIVEGFQCIAIEREADYLPLIEARISRRRDPVRAIQLAAEDLGLFGIDLDGGAA